MLCQLNFKKDKIELWIESRTELDMPVPQIILEENNITSDNHLGLDLMCHSQILTIDCNAGRQTTMLIKNHNNLFIHLSKTRAQYTCDIITVDLNYAREVNMTVLVGFTL